MNLNELFDLKGQVAVVTGGGGYCAGPWFVLWQQQASR